jgi:HAD superfamily hydrolase (TIGR01509 family)
MPHDPLMTRKHWIFDMDGTLTMAQHDFDAIRDELGLPQGLPILESLDLLPTADAAPLHLRLNEIELDIAHQAKAAMGAVELLEYLRLQDAKLGILTRNNVLNIGITLKAAGLDNYFLPENLFSRECALPKPSPDGILGLLGLWQAYSDDAVMVGDHQHDLHSGNAAGTATIYVDPSGEFPFKADADVCIEQLTELIV